MGNLTAAVRNHLRTEQKIPEIVRYAAAQLRTFSLACAGTAVPLTAALVAPRAALVSAGCKQVSSDTPSASRTLLEVPIDVVERMVHDRTTGCVCSPATGKVLEPGCVAPSRALGYPRGGLSSCSLHTRVYACFASGDPMPVAQFVLEDLSLGNGTDPPVP